MPGVFALGVASDFLDSNTLYLNPGQDYSYGIRLQNVQDKPVAVIIESEGIGKIVDQKEKYLLEPMTTKNPINFEIHMPDNATEKDIYYLSWSVREVSDNDGGMISTSKEITGSISIMIKPKEQPSNSFDWKSHWQPIASILAILILLCFFVFRKRKDKGVKTEGVNETV
jgi:hypothetical protein